jgi:hypothetical protein
MGSDESFCLTKQELLPSQLLTVAQVFAMPADDWTTFAQGAGLQLSREAIIDSDDYVEDVYHLLLDIINAQILSYFDPSILPFEEQELIRRAESCGDMILAAILEVRLQERRMLLELKSQIVGELKDLRDECLETDGLPP